MKFWFKKILDRIHGPKTPGDAFMAVVNSYIASLEPIIKKMDSEGIPSKDAPFWYPEYLGWRVQASECFANILPEDWFWQKNPLNAPRDYDIRNWISPKRAWPKNDLRYLERVRLLGPAYVEYHLVGNAKQIFSHRYRG